jgi:hypothetical protein
VKSIEASDVAAIAGLMLLAGGAGWIYRPAAPIILGIAFIVYACFAARMGQPGGRRQ